MSEESNANNVVLNDVTADGTYTGSEASPNGIPSDLATVIAGKVYAFRASNGFTTNQSFDTIRRVTQTVLAQYDVTGALELLMDVRLFNAKLGIRKDNQNVVVTNPSIIGEDGYYDSPNNVFKQNSIQITTSDFLGNLTTEGVPNLNRIITVGKFSTLYSDFAQYVASYFGFPSATENKANSGFSTLFSNDDDFNPNGGVFDATALYKLLTRDSTLIDTSGASVSTLTGAIDISNVTQLLANAVDTNVFGNRNPKNGGTSNYMDPSGNRNNYGITDGFYADDIFFIPIGGLTVTLTLGVDSELFTTPLNNVGLAYDASTGAIFDASTAILLNSSAGVFTSTSTSSTTSINRTLSIPLVIRLANLTVGGEGYAVPEYVV